MAYPNMKQKIKAQKPQMTQGIEASPFQQISHTTVCPYPLLN